MRHSGRGPSELREVSIEPNVSLHAEGSCMIRFGNTHVLCTASLEDRVPPFIRNTGLGWVTAEYGMLPRATDRRNRREATAGRPSGRTAEIQRLIGRSLRTCIDRVRLGERQLTIDCDVIQADGGTRCASVTGGWVALRLAHRTYAVFGHYPGKSGHGSCRRGELRHRIRPTGPGSRLRRGQRGRDRCEFRVDGFRKHGRNPVHGRGRSVFPAATGFDAGSRHKGNQGAG